MFRLESDLPLQLLRLIGDSDGVVANNFRVVSQRVHIQTSETELRNNQNINKTFKRIFFLKKESCGIQSRLL
jgi:hypothetical protein